MTARAIAKGICFLIFRTLNINQSLLLIIGCQGVVIEGRCRDLQEHRDQDFPVRLFFFRELSTDPDMASARYLLQGAQPLDRPRL